MTTAWMTIETRKLVSLTRDRMVYCVMRLPCLGLDRPRGLEGQAVILRSVAGHRHRLQLHPTAKTSSGIV